MKEFWKGVFSDGGSPSSSRVLMGLHSLFSCGCLAHATYHNHAIPDAVTLGGLAAFATAPYAVGQIKSMISAGKSQNGSAQ
jgi:hypothetical protein